MFYGKDQLESLIQIGKSDLKSPLLQFLIPTLMATWLKITIPVYRDANLGLKKMQPIVFSHGLKAHRNIYAGLCMELASCGYFVITISHND